MIIDDKLEKIMLEDIKKCESAQSTVKGSKELFQKAQYLQLRDTRVSPQNKKVHMLAGFVYCADCQKAMTRQKTKGNVYYYCRTYREK